MTDSREIKAKVTHSGHNCAASYKELLEQVSLVSTQVVAAGGVGERGTDPRFILQQAEADVEARFADGAARSDSARQAEVGDDLEARGWSRH